MLLFSPRSPKASELTIRRHDPAVAAILEFGSPSAAVVAAPVPSSARRIVWVISSMFAAAVAAMGLIPIDRVVTAPGRVVSKVSALVVQPLETSIVRAINVTEGQTVHAGDVLAQLDPTFAAAEVGSLAPQVAALRAEVSRLQAEASSRPFAYTGSDTDLALQAAIYEQRQSERNFRLETYQQRIESLQATVARSIADVEAYRARDAVAKQVESMRQVLLRQQLDSRLSTLAATDSRLEVERGLANAINTVEGGQRDLAAIKA